VVVDFTSSRQEAHTHYVALSRVRTLDGLFILNLCDNKIHISNYVKQEMAALRAERRMTLSLHFPYLHQSLHITFLNVRSLHKHIDLVRNDPILSASHINVYCETRTSDTDCSDTYNIDGFYSVMYHSQSQTSSRPHYGLALYSKLQILQSCQLVSFAESLGTVECALLQAAVEPSVILSVVCLYRRPSSDFTHFTTAMSRIMAKLSACQSATSDVTHQTIIMGDFNLDWLEESTPARITALLPGYRQHVTEVTTDYASALDHVYTNVI